MMHTEENKTKENTPLGAVLSCGLPWFNVNFSATFVCFSIFLFPFMIQTYKGAYISAIANIFILKGYFYCKTWKI